MAGTYLVGEKTKAAILKGSKKLFYKKGYAATTYNDISSYLQINRALIPYHFDSKQALAASVYNEIVDTAFNESDELLSVSELSDDLASAIHIVIYYRLFNDKQFTAFTCDLIDEGYELLTDTESEKTLIRNLDKYFSKLDDNTFELICSSMTAVRFNLIKCMTDGSYYSDTLATHFIELALRYAGVSKKDIKELIDGAIQLADLITCDIRPGFQISVSYR